MDLNHHLCTTKAIAECYQLTTDDVEENTQSFFGMLNSSSTANLKLSFSPDVCDILKLLLLKYHRDFSIPTGLPPSKKYDHMIPFKLNTNPIKVKPYRYPHSKKNEIKLMVAKILEEGLIEPSNSLFSSLALLVKNKDGSS